MRILKSLVTTFSLSEGSIFSAIKFWIETSCPGEMVREYDGTNQWTESAQSGGCYIMIYL